MMAVIEATEDIEAFWKNLGNRDKLYRVRVGDKEYKNMTLTYRKNEYGEDEFIFQKVKNERINMGT